MFVGNRNKLPVDLIDGKYSVQPGGCWEWQGTLDSNGYGVLKINYRQHKAHRVAYAAYVEDPKGMFVCHHCDNPKCINPKHLFLGTPADNMKDKATKGRASRFVGERNPMSKLTDEQTACVVDDSRTQREIAQAYGISQSRVSKIKTTKRKQKKND